MRRPVCYDITRLLTRILNATPNGIDRVDHVLAQHFLAGAAGETFASTCTGIGARLLRGQAALEAVGGIARHWGETGRDIEADPIYRHVRAWIAGEQVAMKAPRRPRTRLGLPFPVSAIGYWAARHGLPVRRNPRDDLPAGAVYVNTSQFPLWVASSFEWLEARPDVKAVFFVHDLLPVTLPEYFREAEYERHRARMRNVARFASAVIVTTATVAAELRAHMAELGRSDLPVFVRPTPISPIFSTPREIDPDLAGHSFFVLCSTIEPRKNHLMILAAWRDLARRLGSRTPKLLLVGTRGWHYDPIIDLIERSPPLRDHVLEVNGLSTPGLKRLIDNADALLMPSFGEGYGLPVHEALAAGCPVIASNVAAFLEIAAEGLTRVSPLDGEGWLRAIEARVGQRAAGAEARLVPVDWGGYFEKLDAFVEAL